MATKDSHHFPTSESQPCPKFRFERFHPIPTGGLEADSLALARGPPEPIHQKMMVLPSLVGLHVALLIRRLRHDPAPAGQGLAQAVFDAMFSDMDVNLREMADAQGDS